MKGQSLVMQFVLFFLIGFTIFLAVGNLFKTQSDIFKENVAALSAKLTNAYLSSAIITTVNNCKQCDYVDLKMIIPETYGGYFQEINLNSKGVNVSSSNKQSVSSIHNLNSTLSLVGSSSSAKSKWVPEEVYTITTFSDNSPAKKFTFDATLNPWYYEQEYANSTSSEGLCYDSDTAEVNPEKAFDGNWDTYVFAVAGSNCRVYENYTIAKRNDVENINITYKFGKAPADAFGLWIFNHSSTKWVRVVYYPTGNYIEPLTQTFVIEGKNIIDFVSSDGNLSYLVNMTEGVMDLRYYESKIAVEYAYPSIRILKHENITFISATMNISGYAYLIEEDDTEDSWKCEYSSGESCYTTLTNLPENMVDENWASYYWGGLPRFNLNYLYVNYTIPSKVSKVEWKLRVFKNDIGSAVSCYNSIFWEEIGSYIWGVKNVVFKLDDKCLMNPIQLRTVISQHLSDGLVYEEMIVLYRFYPSNLSLDIASDGIKDWSIIGELNSTNSPQIVNLKTTAIQNFLSTCTTDAEGYCLVPLSVSSDSVGIVELSNLKVEYYTSTIKKVEKPITLTYDKNKNKIEVS